MTERAAAVAASARAPGAAWAAARRAAPGRRAASQGGTGDRSGESCLPRGVGHLKMAHGPGLRPPFGRKSATVLHDVPAAQACAATARRRGGAFHANAIPDDDGHRYTDIAIRAKLTKRIRPDAGRQPTNRRCFMAEIPPIGSPGRSESFSRGRRDSARAGTSGAVCVTSRRRRWPPPPPPGRRCATPSPGGRERRPPGQIPARTRLAPSPASHHRAIELSSKSPAIVGPVIVPVIAPAIAWHQGPDESSARRHGTDRDLGCQLGPEVLAQQNDCRFSHFVVMQQVACNLPGDTRGLFVSCVVRV